jgi:hypothetical protein
VPVIRLEIVRLVFLACAVAYLYVSSLFVHTSHTLIAGDRHLFGYSAVGFGLATGFNVIPLGMAWYLWRWRRDRLGAGIFLLMIPLFVAFVLPQLLMERVEVTPTHLKHRREPPHTRFNADVEFDDIAEAVELQHAGGGTVGYRLRLKDGRQVELPANEVLTAAHDTIDVQLEAHHVPTTVVEETPTPPR